MVGVTWAFHAPSHPHLVPAYLLDQNGQALVLEGLGELYVLRTLIVNGQWSHDHVCLTTEQLSHHSVPLLFVAVVYLVGKIHGPCQLDEQVNAEAITALGHCVTWASWGCVIRPRTDHLLDRVTIDCELLFACAITHCGLDIHEGFLVDCHYLHGKIRTSRGHLALVISRCWLLSTQ